VIPTNARHPVQRHVEEAGVEVLGEQLLVGVPQFPQLLPHLQHVLEQHVGRCVGLAGEEDPVRHALLHRTLEPCEDGEGRAVALAGAGRTLDQQHRRPGVPPDKLPLARLEVVEQPCVPERVQPGEERLLAGRAVPVAGRRGLHQPVEQSVRRPGAEPVDHLGAPVGVPLVGARVERGELAALQGPVDRREHERLGPVAATGLLQLDLCERLRHPARIVLLGSDDAH
jgi:hypothetical protein